MYTINTEKKPAPQQNNTKRHSILYYLSVIFISIIMCIFLLFGLTWAFLASSTGGKITANYLSNTFNKLNTGIELKIAQINLIWLGVKVLDVEIMDSKGEFLKFSTLVFDINAQTLIPDKNWNYNIQINNVEIDDVFVEHIPAIKTANAEQDELTFSPKPLTFLPDWLQITFNQIKINNATIDLNTLSPNTFSAEYSHLLNANLDAKLSLTHNTADFQVKVYALPILVDSDNTHTINASEKTELNLSGSFNNDKLQIHVNGSDIYILQNFWLNKVSMTDQIPYKITLNTKVTAHIPTIPPQKESPLTLNVDVDLDMYNVSKKSYLSNEAKHGSNADFAKLAKVNKIKIKGDFSYDAKQYLWENVKLSIPAQNPNIFIEGKGNYSTASVQADNSTKASKLANNNLGIGNLSTKIKIQINSLDNVLQLFFVNKYKIKGSLKSTFDINSKNNTLLLTLNSQKISSLNGDINGIDLNFSINSDELIKDGDKTIPNAVHGILNLEAKSLFAMGQAKLSSMWTISNLSPLIKHLQANSSTTGKTVTVTAKKNVKNQTGFEQLNYLLKTTNLDINIKQLSAELPGIKLSAKIHQRGQNIKQGVLDINVQDMQALVKLTGLPIEGSPLKLKINTLPSSTLTKPIFDSTFALGAGSYADFYWQSAQGKIISTLNESNFEFSLDSSILALIRGSFDYSVKTLNVDYLSIHEKDSNIKVALKQSATVQFGNETIISDLKLAINPLGNLDINAIYSPNSLHIDAQIKDVSLDLFKPFLKHKMPKGMAEANIQIGGTPSEPNGSIQIQIKDIDFENNLPKLALIIDGELKSKTSDKSTLPYISLNAKLIGTNLAENLKITADLPIIFLIKDYKNKILPINADIAWEGNLNPLYAFVPHDGSVLEGFASINAQIRGDIQKPLIKAQAYIVNGQFIYSMLGMHINNITLEALFDSNARSLIKFSATDNQQGTIIFNGDIPSSALLNEQLDIKGQIRNFKPLNRDDISIQLSGDVSINGTIMEPVIEGIVYIDKANVQLLQTTAYGSITTLDVKEKRPKLREKTGKRGKKQVYNARISMQLIAPNNLFIRAGTFLDSEWKANLNITGELTSPSVTGNVLPVQGKLLLMGSEFQFVEEGGIIFDGNLPVNPLLNLKLELKSTYITALILISGTGNNPRLNITSYPLLPKDEIISYLLFNKNFNELSHFELIQVATAASELINIGKSNLNLLTSIRTNLGFEVLRFSSKSKNENRSAVPEDASMQHAALDSDINSSTSIEAGKYILDNVYLGIGQDISTNFGTEVIIEIELMPNVILEGKTSDSSNEIGLNWKMDY